MYKFYDMASNCKLIPLYCSSNRLINDAMTKYSVFSTVDLVFSHVPASCNLLIKIFYKNFFYKYMCTDTLRHFFIEISITINDLQVYRKLL